VSAHPAFPAIVALWFAALLGLGSLVLPIGLFENLSEATGLASLVVVAQPPLGVTARILIALVASGLGVVMGVAIARKVVVANTPKPAPRRTAAKRPISAHEELGEGGLDADEEDEAPRGPIPGRRRALSVTDDSARSEFLDHAPLPGHDMPAHPAATAEPLDLAEFDAAPDEEFSEPAAEEEPAMIEPAARPPWQQPGEPFGTAALSRAPLSNDYLRPARASAFHAESASQADQEISASADRSLAQLSIADLVERFARALESHRAEAQPASAAPEASPVLDVTFAFAPKGPAADQPPPAIPAALRPLGFAELADGEDDDEIDLGLTLATNSASRPFAAPVAEAVAIEDEEEAEEAADESYSSLLAMKGPAGLPREPVRIEDELDDAADGLIEPVVVFPGQMRRAAPVIDGPGRDAAGASAVPGARPFDAPSVRAEAAMNGFAGTQSSFAANSGDTERALREALEKLQKMSGAA